MGRHAPLNGATCVQVISQDAQCDGATSSQGINRLCLVGQDAQCDGATSVGLQVISQRSPMG